MDRNRWGRWREQLPGSSLSARRAWIEISMSFNAVKSWVVALRKESVDRNNTCPGSWISAPVALRKESVDRNSAGLPTWQSPARRSP